MYLWPLSLIIILSCLSLQALASADSEKQGYWWYQDPIIAHQEESPYPKPALPGSQEMMAMHPKELEKLLEEHRNYAVYTLNPDDVANYYRVQDAVRRKANAFSSLSQYTLLQNPELNANSAYPTTTSGQNQQKQQTNQLIDNKLQQVRDQYAFGFFHRTRV